MHQVMKSSCALALFLSCSQAYGQMPDLPPDETPMTEVRAWTSGAVLNATAALDSRITTIQRWNIAYTVGTPSLRSGANIADQIALMLHTAGLPSERSAVMLVNVSSGNRNAIPSNSTDLTPYPAVIAHEYDTLAGVPSLDPIENAITPWKYYGIIDGAAWMTAFVNQLYSKVTSNYIEAPSRFLFDDEPPDFFVGTFHLDPTNFPHVVEYWETMKLDGRWDTLPVPGFGSDTMEDLWYDAVNYQSVTDPTVPGSWSGDYHGGSATNQAWVTWFRNLMLQAEAGAMQAAFYDVIHVKFPDAKCSDYDRTMWTDGSNGGINSWIPGDQRGAESYRYNWDGQGDLQAPCMYPMMNGYFYERTVHCPDPFAVTNDDLVNELDWCIYEPFGIFSSRIHRFTADACVRSFSGSRKGAYEGSAFKGTLAPWIHLPGQYDFLKGTAVNVSHCSTTAYLPFAAFGNGIFYRSTREDTRRTLALARARGSAEVHFWCDNSFYMNTNVESCLLEEAYENINASVHPHHDYSYSLLPKLLDQVWGFAYYSKSVPTGTVTAGGSSSPPALEFAFGDPLQVTAVSTDKLRTAVHATFTNSYSPIRGNPPFLRINVEAASTHATTLRVFVRDFTNSQWDEVDLDPTGNTPDAADMPGGSPGKTKRVTGLFPATADHFGSVGEVTVRLETEGDTVSGTQSVSYDLVQVVAEDTDDFAPADLNLDGVVNCADRKLYDDIYYAANIVSPHPNVRSLADFEQDGDVDIDDLNAFLFYWNIGCADFCIEPDPCE